MNKWILSALLLTTLTWSPASRSHDEGFFAHEGWMVPLVFFGPLVGAAGFVGLIIFLQDYLVVTLITPSGEMERIIVDKNGNRVQPSDLISLIEQKEPAQIEIVKTTLSNAGVL